MDKGNRLGRVLVPLVTPFAADGRVDFDCLQRLTAEVLDSGAQGVVALATTGEPTSLEAHERDQVVAVCAAVCADRSAQLLVGAGTNDTRTTIARHEALAGIPALVGSLAVVPYYVRPSEAAIVSHFQLVADRSPVPLTIYNIPYRTGRGLGAEALLELAATDNIVGLKQAVGGIDVDTLVVLRDAPSDFSVLGGDDPYLLPVVLMGGAGAIAASAHLCTARFVEMIDRGLEGDTGSARLQAEALLPLIVSLFAEPSPAVIKGVLHAQGRIPTPDVRMPLGNASADAVHRAIAALDRLR